MGRYIDRSDIDAIFGKSNVDKWADMDNDGSPDDSRVSNAIASAEDRVDSTLRKAKYAIPFTGSIPRDIKDIAARLAGSWLYSGRGIDDRNEDGEPIDPIQQHRDRAERDLKRIVHGQLELDAPIDTTEPDAPTVIH